ncbi:MAG: hypothetical protein QOD24_74 [Solirubrobacteraceae bacterium]|nr:hypothetical protein [Solirubrobacteraceae bacterium]
MADGARPDGPEVQRHALTADESEAGLLARFTAHGVFDDIEARSQDAFLALLLQRRFLSLLFPVVYDIGIDGLIDERAVRLVREILREEYPDASGTSRSHREDLVCDLLALGATRSQILESRPTAVTASVVEETLALILDAAAAARDVGVLTILRFWGEVLVSVEYGQFWRRMDGQFQAAGTTSSFYRPHLQHDGCEPLATASESLQTHSGRLGGCLVRMLEADGDVEQFAETERRVLAARMRFYDQFVEQDGVGTRAR